MSIWHPKPSNAKIKPRLHEVPNNSLNVHAEVLELGAPASKAPPPRTERLWFRDHTEAERARAELRAANPSRDYLTTITPVPPPKPQARPLFDDLPDMGKRLTE
jgi:hypothetical protein